jgi:hypothetical protein
MRYSDDWSVAMAAAFLLVLAMLLSRAAAGLSGRAVRALSVLRLAASPSSVAPERRRLVATVFLVMALAPQVWVAFLVVVQPFGLGDLGRTILAGELTLVAVWLVYLDRLPRDEGARSPGPSVARAAAPRGSGKRRSGRTREPEPGAAWWAWTGVGVALLAVVAWAWLQPYGMSSFPPPVAIPAVLIGAMLVREGDRIRKANVQPTRRR